MVSGSRGDARTAASCTQRELVPRDPTSGQAPRALRARAGLQPLSTALRLCMAAPVYLSGGPRAETRGEIPWVAEG